MSNDIVLIVVHHEHVVPEMTMEPIFTEALAAMDDP